jgi:hypothetical protein
MSNTSKINFVDNYIKYLTHKYFIFTQQDDQTEIYNVEPIKNVLKNIDFSKMKNTDKYMIDLTKQISNTFCIYTICDKTKVDLDDKIYLHYKKYKCLKYKVEDCC